jgi:hypothetical protein
VQFHQGADQRAEPQEIITRTGQQADGRAAGSGAAQPDRGERLPRSPAELVQEREHGIGGSDCLQPGKRRPGDGDLNLVQHRLILPGRPQPG